ncbi:unnamed protein product, partial [Owenia fusiformis]
STSMRMIFALLLNFVIFNNFNEMPNKETVAKYIRGWVGAVGIMAIGNTYQCFRDPRFFTEKIYTEISAKDYMLSARLFGIWNFLTASLRLYCAFFINNRQVYNFTLWSFLLSLVHFLSEVLIYKSAAWSPGLVTTLLVSVISIVVMIIGYWYIDSEEDMHRESLERKTR